MKFFRSRIFWGLFALALATGAVFIGLPYLNGQTRETIMVVRVKQPVAAETRITEDMLMTVEVGAYNCPDEVFTSVKSVAGLYAAVDLLPSDNLVPDKFSVELNRENESFYSLPESGKVIVSVPLSSLAASVSGKIQPNDVVTVYGVMRNTSTDAYEVLQYPELQYMRVTAVTNSVAVETSEVDLTDTTTSKSDVVPVTVSLYACEFQARRLIEIQSIGSVYIALVGRGQAADEIYDGFTPVNPYIVLETPDDALADTDIQGEPSPDTTVTD